MNTSGAAVAANNRNANGAPRVVSQAERNAILAELNPKLLMSSEELAMKKFKNQAERNKLRAALKARYPLARQNQINQLVKANKSTIEAARKEKSALFNQRVSRIRNWAIAAAQLPAFGPLNKSNKNSAALKKDYEAFRKYYIQELNRIILHTGKSNWRSYGVGAATRFRRLRESAEDFRIRRKMNYELARRAGKIARIHATSPFNRLRAKLGSRFARTPGTASANEIQKILNYKQRKLNRLAQVQGQLATEQSNAATRAANNSNSEEFFDPMTSTGSRVGNIKINMGLAGQSLTRRQLLPLESLNNNRQRQAPAPASNRSRARRAYNYLRGRR